MNTVERDCWAAPGGGFRKGERETMSALGSIRLLLLLTMVMLSGCAPRLFPAQVPLTECTASWDTFQLPPVDKKCESQKLPHGGINIYAYSVQNEDLDGVAVNVESTSPLLVDAEKLQTAIKNTWLDKGEASLESAPRTMMAPWGEEIEVRDVKLSDPDAPQNCLVWSDQTFESDKYLPEGTWVTVRDGIICTEDEDPAELLEFVRYDLSGADPSLESCAVTWNESKLPEPVKQGCTRGNIRLMTGEVIHSARFQGATIGGEAVVVRLKTPIEIDPERSDVLMRKNVVDDTIGDRVEWQTPEKVGHTPWGEEAKFQEFKFSHLEDEHLCVVWTNHDNVGGKLQEAKGGYACSEGDPYALLEAIQYRDPAGS